MFRRAKISKEHRDKFRFDHLVVVAPCDDASGGRPAATSGPAMLSDFYFSRFDDEVLLQVRVVTYIYMYIYIYVCVMLHVFLSCILSCTTLFTNIRHGCSLISIV